MSQLWGSQQSRQPRQPNLPVACVSSTLSDDPLRPLRRGCADHGPRGACRVPAQEAKGVRGPHPSCPLERGRVGQGARIQGGGWSRWRPPAARRAPRGVWKRGSVWGAVTMHTVLSVEPLAARRSGADPLSATFGSFRSFCACEEVHRTQPATDADADAVRHVPFLQCSQYAVWEEQQGDLPRARSVWERALDVSHRNVSVWLKYAEMARWPAPSLCSRCCPVIAW